MISNATHHSITRGLAVTSVAALSACGGGGGSGGGGGPVVVSTDTPPVLATVSNDFAASSVAFPYYYADVDLDRDIVRGISSIRIIDADTIELVDSEGGNTFWLVRDSGDVENGIFDFVTAGTDGILGTGDDVVTSSQFEIIERAAAYYALFLLNDDVDSNGFPIRERVGGFGFETADGDMPTVDTAEYEGPSWLYVISDDAEVDDPSYTVIEGDFFMTADFGDMSVDGTAFTGDELVTLDDVGEANDDLSLTIGLSGSISGNKIDGTVTGDDASVRLNGAILETPLTLSLTNSDVDGQFFGVAAGGVNGTWGADFTLSDGSDSLTGEVGGFFEGGEIEP